MNVSAAWMVLGALGCGLIGCGSDASDTPGGSNGADAGVDTTEPDGVAPESAPEAAQDSAQPSEQRGPFYARRAEQNQLSDFALDQVVVAQDGALELAAGSGHEATDPYPAGSYSGGNYYNGGSYHFGVARSTEWPSDLPFDSVVPSFEAETPAGTWIELDVAARIGGQWTKDYILGIWASTTQTVARHSVDGQSDTQASVLTDTLSLKAKADALRLTVQLFSEDGQAVPRVRALYAIVAAKGATAPSDQPTPAARGKVLDVPQRSQLMYPEGGVWCSPTSVSMLLGYWATKLPAPALDEGVPTAAAGIYDRIYDGTGNWPFNTAYASSVGGGLLHGFVTRLSSMHQLERLIAADIPVAVSISFANGELTGAPGASTDGHLIVVRGFTEQGDVVCNDPWFPKDGATQVTYIRSELEQAWSHSQRTTYVAWPKTQAKPVDPLGAYF